ncbi:MAG: hypothetical protein HY394_06075 [Candidatus Diapherotrites archaeon]|nr:hypothetical protein [Candidatus Diapherotrites archaeon]
MFRALSQIFSEEHGQISVELIIVLAAVVAMVLLLVSQLQETGSEGAKVINKKTGEIFKKIDEI